MSEAHKFTSLPTRVLERIALYALESTPSHTFTFLSSLGSAVSEAATRHLFSTMSVEDDDAILVEAEEQDPTSACRTMWCSVFRDPKLGELVRELIVTNAGEVGMVGRGRSELVFEEDGEGDEGTAVTPLDSQSFGALLKRLPNLTKFSWTATRSPPAELCAYLGSSARTLVSFSLDLPPPSPSDDKSHAAPKSTERWDATDISRLPLSLRSLSVSHVSLEGSRALASAFSSLPNLESLVISESMFIDDAFMRSLGDAKRLKKLRISSMHGTKLTEKGLGELFEGCTGLEELTLDSVEGRLSKSTWKTLSPLPDSLHTLRIAYSEQGPHKTWATDHLDSIVHAISSPSLTSLEISRTVPLGALGSAAPDAVARHTISEVVAPRAMDQKLLEVIINRASEWKSLDLDFFLMEPGILKRILDKAPNLEELKVLFNAPLKQLLTLASSFALAQSLHHVHISIPPSHIPTPTFVSYPTPSSPSSLSLSTSPRSPLSPSQPIESSIPATREWRRFLKRTHRLESLTWGGRGGMGCWKFFKGGAGTYRVEFESFVCSHDQEGEGRRRESIGWGSVSPGRGGVRRTRRASEVSEYESGEPATPEGVEVGLGLGLAFVAVPEEGRGRILGYGERREEEEEMDRAFPKIGKSPVISSSPSSPATASRKSMGNSPGSSTKSPTMSSQSQYSKLSKALNIGRGGSASGPNSNGGGNGASKAARKRCGGGNGTGAVEK